MGFALTVLYFVTTYLGTDTVFGPLYVYRVELIIAALVFFISLPSLPASFMLKTPQSLALVGLALAVFLSVLMTGWAGGAAQALQDFIPNAFAYFLVCLHCNSKRKLQVLVLLLLFVSLFVIARGSWDLHHLSRESSYLKSGDKNAANSEQKPMETPYLLAQQSESGEWFYRLRGQNFINDPNDFAQLIVCLIPLVFIFWRQKRRFRNTLFVLLPVCGLIYGAFLTHSRGFLLAFLAMAIMAGRRRVGTIPSLLGAVGLFFAASTMNFTGGRGVSVDAGSGRMELWAEGLAALKSHPLFGVGFGRLPDLIGMTAHNSIVVCAAELGMVGLYFWSLFLFPTLRDALAIASPAKVSEGEPIVSKEALFPHPTGAKDAFDKAEINHLGELIILSLTGFLVAGLFLSRAFVLTFFLLGGIAEVVFEMALQRGMIPSRLKLDRVLLYAGITSVSLVLAVSIILHVTALIH